MGYSTNFTGGFRFVTEPSVKVIRAINALNGDDKHKEGLLNGYQCPGGYCQWCVNQNLDAIVWDSGEKFYSYIEWLQYIVDAILKPAKIKLTGQMIYQGDSPEDRGYILVEDWTIVKREDPGDAGIRSKEDLAAFRDLTLKSPYGPALLKRWRER